jgi:hypothetical protein
VGEPVYYCWVALSASKTIIEDLPGQVLCDRLDGNQLVEVDAFPTLAVNLNVRRLDRWKQGVTMMTKPGYSPVKVDRSPDDTTEETVRKAIAALKTAQAEYEANKRVEEERRKQSFLRRIFG